MLEKRLIVCLDVKDGRTTKGIKFKDNVDVGDPVAMARAYYEQGVDELVFYDITASAERRAIRIDTVRRVAENVFIPFSVGGGISTVEEMREVLLAGAEKVSVNSAAVRAPDIISGGAALYGTQCIVLGMDIARNLLRHARKRDLRGGADRRRPGVEVIFLERMRNRERHLLIPLLE